ncbi:MAG: serine hydrolase domain-containing protein [Syntrophothermus sp.]
MRLEMNKYLIIAAFVSAFAFAACEKLLLNPEGNRSPLPVQHQSRLASILDSLRYTLDVPAIAGAIVTDTGVVEARAVGCRRYGGPMNVTDNDQFHLGSCGKAFTSVLMAVLVDEGKVKWATTLPEIFPEYAGAMRPEYRDITIRQILSHSAGLMRDPKGINLKSIEAKSQRLEVLEWALRQAPVLPAGKYLYSNLGYIMAGAIIEKLTNSTYEELIISRVTKPLGITTAGIGGPMGTLNLEDQPLQHTCNHAPVTATSDACLSAIYNPAGGLYMSIGDWGKFVQWTLKAAAGEQTLLKSETAREIISPVVSDGYGGYYGLGWGVSNQEWAGGKALSHSGSNALNYSTVLISVPKKFGIIVMTNQGAAGEDWPIGPVFARLLDYHLNKR